jgi:hypothetical protein
MIIANPLYDVIFKYLMEDMESAKTIISSIIEREIISLTLLPQEQTLFSEKLQLTVMRMDFKAIIKIEEGKFEKILI